MTNKQLTDINEVRFMLTDDEIEAINWALQRLRSCYADSLRALHKGYFFSISDKNVKHYTSLQKLLKRDEAHKSHVKPL